MSEHREAQDPLIPIVVEASCAYLSTDNALPMHCGRSGKAVPSDVAQLMTGRVKVTGLLDTSLQR